MTSRRLRRSGAVLISSAVVTALAVTALAGPAAAAKPKCMGQEATIIGTDGDDELKGTSKRDVIVAKDGDDVIVGRGGNDIICAGAGNDLVIGNTGKDKVNGGVGNDRLFGGAGADRVFGASGKDLIAGGAANDQLFGGPGDDLLAGGKGPDWIGGGKGNDTLNGGDGVDLCSQGTGAGAKIKCELPKEAVATPKVEPKDLVVAYSDIDDTVGYSAGDNLIAKIVDTNLDGKVSKGDTIEMDKYPKELWPGTPDKPAPFGQWQKKSHEIMHVNEAGRYRVDVSTAAGRHMWIDDKKEVYTEEVDSPEVRIAASTPTSRIIDAFAPGEDDIIDIQSGSPGDPDDSTYSDDGKRPGDARHVLEVDINL